MGGTQSEWAAGTRRYGTHPGVPRFVAKSGGGQENALTGVSAGIMTGELRRPEKAETHISESCAGDVWALRNKGFRAFSRFFLTGDFVGELRG